MNKSTVKDKKERDRLYDAADRARKDLKYHKNSLEMAIEKIKKRERVKKGSPEYLALRRLEKRLYGQNLSVTDIVREIDRVQRAYDFLGARGSGALVSQDESPYQATSKRPTNGWVDVRKLTDGSYGDETIHVTSAGIKQGIDALARTLVHEASHLTNDLRDIPYPQDATRGMYGRKGAAAAVAAGLALVNNDNWVYSVKNWPAR